MLSNMNLFDILYAVRILTIIRTIFLYRPSQNDGRTTAYNNYITNNRTRHNKKKVDLLLTILMLRSTRM